MNLKSYINFSVLLERNISSREENRAFGLVHVTLKKKPIAQFIAWQAEHLLQLSKPRLSDTFVSYLSNISAILFLFALILGLFSGLALLSYNGHEPVNVVYFMAMVVVLPLFTMLLSLIALFRINQAHSLLVHLSPASWMQKILSFFPSEIQENIKAFKVNPLILNALVIKRSQWLALSFSFGLLLALLGMVITKDLAFAWSTTLAVSPAEFHHFLNILAYPWREFVPSAVPSVLLVEQSQYFRLGEVLSPEMLSHASSLGLWWKFLLFLTLFYALFLRFLLLVFSHIRLQSAIKKSFLTLRGSGELLREMNESIISTHALEAEARFEQNNGGYQQILKSLDSSYDLIQGWALSQKKLLVVADSMHVLAPEVFEVGGGNSFDEDNEILSKSQGEVLLFVKGWEPPTLDFVDYLEGLVQKVEKVVIAPIGTIDNHYKIDSKMLDVWERKLIEINDNKVCLKR